MAFDGDKVLEHRRLLFELISSECSVFALCAQVWGIPRSVRALQHRVNVVDLSRRSLTYESRLLKYADRGFAIAVTHLDLKQVDFAAPFSTTPGN